MAMLSLAHRADNWQPPIVKTVATKGEGIEELMQTIVSCSEFFQNSALRQEKKRQAAEQRLTTLLEERLVQTAIERAFADGELSRLIDEIARREKDPYSVVEQIIKGIRFKEA